MAGGGHQGVDPEALLRAEAALAALGGDYPNWARADVHKLRVAVAALRRAGDDDRGRAAAAVFALAHDVKGQAATFGYPLLSRLAMALCRLTAPGASPCATRAEALVAAMGLSLDGGKEDEGGERGRLLVARLEGLGIVVPDLSAEAVHPECPSG